jgi:hypothetical protein
MDQYLVKVKTFAFPVHQTQMIVVELISVILTRMMNTTLTIKPNLLRSLQEVIMISLAQYSMKSMQ